MTPIAEDRCGVGRKPASGLRTPSAKSPQASQEVLTGRKRFGRGQSLLAWAHVGNGQLRICSLRGAFEVESAAKTCGTLRA